MESSAMLSKSNGKFMEDVREVITYIADDEQVSTLVVLDSQKVLRSLQKK